MDFEDNLGTTVLSQILESQTTEILDPDYWDDREQQISEDYLLALF